MDSLSHADTLRSIYVSAPQKLIPRKNSGDPLDSVVWNDDIEIAPILAVFGHQAPLRKFHDVESKRSGGTAFSGLEEAFMKENDGHVQAVLRACDIVKAFRHEGEVLVLADVMERTGLHRTTAFRLLQTLVRGGLLEKTARGVFRCPFPPFTARRFRLVSRRKRIQLLPRRHRKPATSRGTRTSRPDHGEQRYRPKEALRNADLLVHERVDLVLEYQTYERVAPIVASKFLEAHIPVIAIEILIRAPSTLAPITTRPGLSPAGRWAGGPRNTGMATWSR